MDQCSSSFNREDTYVRVCGHLKSFQDNKCSIIAFSINPIKDFNEITYHMLDVIHAHLSASKVRQICFEIAFLTKIIKISTKRRVFVPSYTARAHN